MCHRSDGKQLENILTCDDETVTKGHANIRLREKFKVILMGYYNTLQIKEYTASCHSV